MGKINASLLFPYYFFFLVLDMILCLKPKKEIIWKQKKFLHNAPSKILFWNGIYSFLRRADARGNADIVYRI